MRPRLPDTSVGQWQANCALAEQVRNVSVSPVLRSVLCRFWRNWRSLLFTLVLVLFLRSTPSLFSVCGCPGVLPSELAEEQPAEQARHGQHQHAPQQHQRNPSNEANLAPRWKEPRRPQASTQPSRSRHAKKQKQPPPATHQAKAKSETGSGRRRLDTLALAHAFSLSQRQRHRTP